MKNLKLIILAFLTLFAIDINAQKIFPKAKDKATKKAAENIMRKIKKEDNKEKPIVVMPISNEQNINDKLSDELAKKIVHKLSRLIAKSNLSFSVRFYKEDSIIIKEMDAATTTKANEIEYYEKLVKKYESYYFVKANYNFDEYNNKFIIENITIFTNYKIDEVERKQIPVKNAVVSNDPGSAGIWRSAIVPGWGQIYKEQNTKGYILLSGEILFVAGAFVSQGLYNYNYNEAIKNKKHTDTYNFYINKSDNWYAMRNITIIGAGVFYIYSLIDAAASKSKTKYTAFFNNNKYKIFPVYNNNNFYIGLNINF